MVDARRSFICDLSPNNLEQQAIFTEERCVVGLPGISCQLNV